MKGLCQRPGCLAAGLCVLHGEMQEPMMAPSHREPALLSWLVGIGA